MQSALHRSWLEGAGITVAKGIQVEISPLFALDRSDLQGRISQLPSEIDRDIYLKGPDEQGDGN